VFLTPVKNAMTAPIQLVHALLILDFAI